MTATTKNNKGNQLASAILMLLALLWLTISTPFVYASQQQQQTAAEQMDTDASADDEQNPLAGTNEEKSESGINSISEYLHELELPGQHAEVLVKYEKCHPSDLYLAFHPELLCPPPNNVG